MKAKFSGVCHYCSEPIKIGSEIKYYKQWMHAGCVPLARAAATAPEVTATQITFHTLLSREVIEQAREWLPTVADYATEWIVVTWKQLDPPPGRAIMYCVNGYVFSVDDLMAAVEYIAPRALIYSIGEHVMPI